MEPHVQLRLVVPADHALAMKADLRLIEGKIKSNNNVSTPVSS